MTQLTESWDSLQGTTRLRLLIEVINHRIDCLSLASSKYDQRQPGRGLSQSETTEYQL